MSTRLLSTDHALWFDRVRLGAYLRKHQPDDLPLMEQIMDYYRNRTEDMFQTMATDTQINPTRPWLEEVLPREHQHLVEHLLTEFHDREDQLFQFWFRTYNPEATDYPGADAASAAAEQEVKAEAIAAIDDDKKENPVADAAAAAAEVEAQAEAVAAAAAAERKAKIEVVAAQERRRAAVRAKQTRQVEEDEEQERKLRREQKADAVKAQAAAAEAKATAAAAVTDDEEEESEEDAAKKAVKKAAEKAAKKIAFEQQCVREVERVLQNDGKPLLMLEITAETDATEIKRKYFSKRKLVHPDKHPAPNGHPNATQAFQNLQNAYNDVKNLTPKERRDQFGARSSSTQPPPPQQAPSASSPEEEFCGYGNPKKAEPKPQPETPFGRRAGAKPQQETPFGHPPGAKQEQETPFGRSAGTRSSTKAKTKPAKKSRTTKRPKPTRRPAPTPPPVPTAAARAKAQAHQAASGLPESGMYYVGVTAKGTPCQRCCRNCGEQFCSTRHKTFRWMKL